MRRVVVPPGQVGSHAQGEVTKIVGRHAAHVEKGQHVLESGYAFVIEKFSFLEINTTIVGLVIFLLISFNLL